jgi:DnaK suppressor protein
MTEATKKTESAGTTASKKPAGKVADTTSNKASNKASKNTAAKLAMNGSASPILLPEGYRPSEEEEFMNPLQLLYFRKKLEAWRAELLDEASDTITGLSQENLHQPDQMDRAQIESNAALDLRTRDRERKLLQKIESALRRIDEGSYGYCVETDEPINLRRLEARPIASLSLHAQERHERMERVHRDD